MKHYIVMYSLLRSHGHIGTNLKILSHVSHPVVSHSLQVQLQIGRAYTTSLPGADYTSKRTSLSAHLAILDGERWRADPVRMHQNCTSKVALTAEVTQPGLLFDCSSMQSSGPAGTPVTWCCVHHKATLVTAKGSV